jgi:Ribbon-helix-helix protein, copG family
VQETFAKVKVAFNDLLGWLGNIFNWDAILRTKNMIVTMVDVLLQFTEKLVGVLADKIHNQIVAYDAQIDPAFAALKARYAGGSQSLGQIRAAQPAVPAEGMADAHDAMGVNIAHHALINAVDGPAPVAADGSGAAFFVGPATTFDPTTPIGTALAAMNTAAATFQSTPALTSAQSQADGLSGSPAQILNDAIAGVLEIMRQLAHAALAGADALVQALAAALEDAIEAMRQLLTQPLPHIPVLSDLYQDFVGNPLTVLDCYALVVAIPTTAIHTIVTGSAPFPDQASLDRFTAQLTADALMQRTGLLPAPPVTENDSSTMVPAAAGTIVLDDPKRPEDGWTTAARVFMVMGTVNSFCFIAVDAFLDFYPPEPPPRKPPLKGATSEWMGVVGMVGYGSSLVGALAGLPWWYSSGKPGGDTADEFGRVLWITQLVPIVVDTITMIFGRQLARMDGVLGVYIAEGFGVINLALTITWVVMDLAEGTTDLFSPASALFGAVPGAAKILHSYVVAAATESASLAFLVYLDIVCDTLAAGLGVGSVVLAWNDPISLPPPPPQLTQRTTRLASLALTAGTHISLPDPVKTVDVSASPAHRHLDVRVDDETYQAVHAAAQRSGESMSDVLREAIRHYLPTR